MDIELLECDLAAAIRNKQARARRAWKGERIGYQAIDLNAPAWPQLQTWLQSRRDAGCRVMMEGVSPYIERSRFPAFLLFLGGRLPVGSQVAYDFKVTGANDTLGTSDSVRETFRLPRDAAEIDVFHRRLGYTVRRLVFSDELTRQQIAAAELPSSTVFTRTAWCCWTSPRQRGPLRCLPRPSPANRPPCSRHTSSSHRCATRSNSCP